MQQWKYVCKNFYEYVTMKFLELHILYINFIIPINFLNEFDSVIKKNYSCHRDYQLHKIHILYVSLTQLTRTVTQVSLCNAVVKTVKWHWQSQICKHQYFVVLLCLLSKMWPLLRLWVALPDNLGIIFGHNSRWYTNFNFWLSCCRNCRDLIGRTQCN